MKRLIVPVLAALALSACTGSPTPPTSPPAPPGASTGPSGAAPATPPVDATRAAADLVRQGSEATTQVLASAPVTSEGTLAGATLNILGITATDTSTVVQFALTHPSFTGRFDDRLRNVGEWAPFLKTGNDLIRPTRSRMYANVNDSMAVVGQPYTLLPEPRALFASYAPLPAGVTEVEVLSPVTEEPMTVPVQRGAAPAASGNAELPIVGRVTYLDPNDGSNTTPVTVAVHGVRRVQDATVVYYSAVAAKGAKATNLARFGGGTTMLSFSVSGRRPFPEAMALLDHASESAYTVTYKGPLPQTCSLGSLTIDGEAARSCWAVLPQVPAGTTQVDVVIGGQQVIQDVPVTEGALTPTTDSKDKFPVLGEGWPDVPAEALATATDPEQTRQHVLPIQTVVKQDAITTAGTQLELDTTVLFAYNEATLTPEAQGVLTKAAEQVKAVGKPGKLTIVGHTDSDGPDAANMDLSKRRAQAGADALGPLLGDEYSFDVQGKGETDPIAPNDTDTGKSLNRRVTILTAQ